MHYDLNTGAPSRLDADVAVIGAGAAGITMCRRLLDAGLSVILLESGGLDYEPETAELNDGGSIGQGYYPLKDARLRFFGGTTAIWGGRCAELDPIDLEKRSWVPHSGWPLRFEDLERYYREARLALDLPERAPNASALGDVLPAFDPDKLATPLWSFDGKADRFSISRSRDIADHPRCTVVTHATVREIVAHHDLAFVERLDVRSLSGGVFDVRAKHYVLAAGGIENPRLLLASRSVAAAGLGNQHDQVGRYFMEHPHARGGRIVGGAAWTWLNAFQKRKIDGALVAPTLALSESVQRERGLLNTSLTIAARRPATAQQARLLAAYQTIRHDAAPTRTGRTLWRSLKHTVRGLQRISDPLRPWLLHRMGKLEVALVVRAEQAPNPDSRVLLSGETDGIGMPRVQLDWRTSGLDVESVGGLVDVIGAEAKRLSLGEVEPARWLSDPAREWVTDPLISTHAIGGYHHMGTTRMADDPRRGVTDGFGRVHGLSNLHIAGSSLFPTSGWANPTLTIIALGMRTGDRIIRDLARAMQAQPQQRLEREPASARDRVHAFSQ